MVALRELLASFTVEVDKEGNLAKGNAAVDQLAASMRALQTAMQQIGQQKTANIFGAFGAQSGEILKQLGPTRANMGIPTAPSAFARLQGALQSISGSIKGQFTGAIHAAEHSVHGLHDAFHSMLQALPAPLQHLAHVLTGPLGVAGAAAFAGYELAHMSIEAAEAAKVIDASARKLGISSDSYQVLGAFAKEAGADIGAVGVAIKTLSTAVITPTKETAEAFRKIGINVEDLKGLSPDEVFYKVGGAIGELSDEQTRQQVTAKLMGRGGQELIPIFDGGAEAIAHHRHELEKLAIVYDKDFITRSKRLTGSLEELGLAWEGLKNDALKPLLEPLAAVFRGLGHALVGVRQWVHMINVPRLVLLGFTAAFPALFAAIRPFLPILEGFAIMAGRAALRFALMAAPLLVIEDIIGFFNGEDSETGFLMGKIFGKDGGKAIQQAAIDIKNALGELFGLIPGFETFNKLSKDFSEAWEFAMGLSPGDIKANRVVHGINPITGEPLDASGKSDFDLGNQFGIDPAKITAARHDRGGTIPVPGGAAPAATASSVNTVSVGDTTVIVNGVDPNNAGSVSGAVSRSLSRGRDAIIAPYVAAGAELSI